MKVDKQYITQVSAADLRELAQIANLKVELPLRLEKQGDSVKLYIEEKKFKDMLWSFVSQAVPGMTLSRSDAADVMLDAR